MENFVFNFIGQHNDARMNLAIVLTAARLGANVANHVKCLRLTKSAGDDGKEVITGAVMKDVITGEHLDDHLGVFGQGLQKG